MKDYQKRHDREQDDWDRFPDNVEEERFRKLLRTIFYICDVAGFRIEERIVLTDKRTGKTWR